MLCPVRGRAHYWSKKMQAVQKNSAKKITIAILFLIAVAFYVGIFAKYW